MNDLNVKPFKKIWHDCYCNKISCCNCCNRVQLDSSDCIKNTVTNDDERMLK